MRIKILPQAKKSLKKLSKVDQIAVAEKIRNLINKKTDWKKIRDYKNVYRVRLGSIRVVFKKTKKEVIVILVGHRKDIYNLLIRLVR